MSEQSVNGLNIPSIQNKKAVSFKQNLLNPAMQGTTSMQGAPQNISETELGNRVKNSSDMTQSPYTLPVTIGVGYGLGQAMDVFNPKCEGVYEKSILGRLGAWGDKISTKTWLGSKINNAIVWMNTKWDNLSKKSKIVYSLKNHATRPEWTFAKMPGAGLEGFLSADTENVFKEFLKPISGREPSGFMGIKLGSKGNHFQALEQYGMDQKSIDALATSLKGKPFAEQALALQKEELRLLGADSSMVAKIEGKTGLKGLQKLAKSLKVKKLGFNSIREFQQLEGKYIENSDKILDALSKADQNLKISIWRGHGKLGKIKSHLAGRLVSISEYRNKYIATLGKGNTTALGRFLPKALGWFTEGCTNRFAGGKLAVFMQAFFFADMLIHTFNAPKGEKGKTFAERFVNDFTYFIGMTAGILGMHKIGGFKYAGLDKAGVENYRKLLAEFNKNVKAGMYADKGAYKAAKDAVKAALGTKNIKNPITKLLQKIGKFINIGNERILPYHSTAKANLNVLRWLKNGNIIGVPIRIIIPLAIISPFLAKLTTKCAHAIFGRPTNSVLDEDKEDKKAEAPKDNTNPQQNPAQPTQQGQTTSQHKNPNDYQSDTNLIKQYFQGVKEGQNGTNQQQGVNPNNPNQPNTHLQPGQNSQTPTNGNNPNATPVVNPQNNTQPGANQPGADPQKQNNKDNNTQKEMEPVRTYIPSPQGFMKPNATDTSGIDKLLSEADKAETYGNSILKMN